MKKKKYDYEFYAQIGIVIILAAILFYNLNGPATGLGIVSCLGNNQEEVHQSLVNSKSGISYAEEYKAKPNKWYFLTGPREQIKELALKSFKLGSIKEPVFHSAKFALVDRKGRIRGYYDGVQSGEVSQLFKDVSLLLKD